jgi:hypothetical protein
MISNAGTGHDLSSPRDERALRSMSREIADPGERPQEDMPGEAVGEARVKSHPVDTGTGLIGGEA